MEIPIGIVAGFYPLVAREWAHWHYMNTDSVWKKFRHAIGYLPGYMLGINAEKAAFHWTGGEKIFFDPSGLQTGLLPILGGIALHMAAEHYGINKALDDIGIPLIRI